MFGSPSPGRMNMHVVQMDGRRDDRPRLPGRTLVDVPNREPTEDFPGDPRFTTRLRRTSHL